ncbi:GNAT family N-acetyltransferase [Herbiconiux sp. SYSU D00978]|uniref:GNAT family N-acetyltransferase n=1 Tax=Herbiconiux sp. SYSU D00978 TaxID=2812562 RepID=UPI001A95AAB0|nr:GNAT family N-acetyltransferase [Herbiconiux sp. SYSU D00978]
MTIEPWHVTEPLRTERLVLRAHEWTDADDLLESHSDPEVVRFLPWPVRDRAAVEETLRGKLTQHRAERDGDWLVLAVEEAATAHVVGEVLLRRDAASSELGFAFSRAVWGRGVASEACRAMLALAREWRVAVVLAVVVPGNERSVSLLTRLGFEPDGSEERRGEVLDRYRLALEEEGRDAAASRP